MKIFGITIETKKELRACVAKLEAELKTACSINEQVIEYNEEIGVALEEMKKTFPLTLGETLYDIQLRGEDGKYTKTKASKEHSIINEVIVDKKNYFKLMDRMEKLDVFKTYDEAVARVEDVCVK